MWVLFAKYEVDRVEKVHEFGYVIRVAQVEKHLIFHFRTWRIKFVAFKRKLKKLSTEEGSHKTKSVHEHQGHVVYEHNPF